jgi:glyoxylase-like metal-dependent hydrolase (beta-lactamase superfamily II)
VTPLEIARLRFDLDDAYRDGAGLGEAVLPMLAYHLALPGRSVLVDAPAYVAEEIPAEFRQPGYRPPPPLLAQLASHGVAPEGVTDVIITHAHFDHVNGLTRREAAAWVPAFPNARHLLGRADWRPGGWGELSALIERSLAVVEAHGLMTLADGDLDLGDGLSVAAAPGESPGHQLARAQVGDDVVYVAGDLYHHAAEFAREGRDVRWADAAAMAASKRALAERAAAEGARVFFSHLTGAYRVARDGRGKSWEAVRG